MRVIFLVFSLILVGCSSNPKNMNPQTVSVENIQSEKKIELVTIEKDTIPQVWSDHKVLKMTTEACSNKGVDILTTLGFSQIVKNGTYVYGNYINNRAAIKCTDVGNNTFVYAVVAGPHVKIVERLRNEIVWKL